ncbi:MAG: aldehyde dehydrogenase family protein [Myxococcales bacterium]|nr:aldehyde dehydrogenase family protein [Myxococcales bacterium]
MLETHIEVKCPANGRIVGSVPVTPPEDVATIVLRARAAQTAWGKTSVAERANLLRAVRKRLLARQDDVVECLARQNGKPRTEGLIHEVMEHLELLTYFADEAERILEPRPIPARLLVHRQSYLHYRPRGVLGVVAPWNFPFTIPFGAVAMGLVSGNAVVVKPSEFTPLVADLGREIYLEAGLDPELLHIVHGRGDVGAALVTGGVDLVEFTGSVATGRKVAAICGERLIPCVTELGGKAPALVLADAPIERTVQAVTWGGLANAGQVCASIERLLVHDSIYDAFIPKLVDRVRSLRMGDAMADEEFDVGPLVNERQREITERLVNDAVAKGAVVATGGKRVDGPGLFFEPTVLLNCTAEMDIMNTETFGPVIPVMRMSGEEAMIAEANRSHLGLLAYVFTRRTGHGRELAERIRAGTVMVNDVLATHAMAETPWAGVKQSGIGSVHSEDGLRHMCEARHVNYDTVPWLSRELWWFPYQQKDFKLFRRSLGGLYGRGLDRLKRIVA